MSNLLSLYIACTIFGVGVTIIDMLGILGDLFHGSEHGADGGDHGDHGGDHGDHGGDHGDFDIGHGDHGGDHGDFDIGHGDHSGDHGDFDIGHGDHSSDHGDFDIGHGDHGSDHDDFDVDHGDHGGEHGDEHGAGEHGEKGSLVLQENYRERNILPRILTTARSLVYFSLGFGPVGWFALATGRDTASSLAWSIPVGTVALVGGRLLRRIQRNELDSQLTAEDLIMERGEVLVSIGEGQLGKVRIFTEGTYAERFARAKNPKERLRAGTKIRIVDVSDECVYVEEEEM
jgi:membrane protein implicated in regulation of membrane protease activity